MKKTILFAVALALCASCQRPQPKIQSCDIVPIEQTELRDSSMVQLIEPYRAIQDVEMSVVIGQSDLLLHPEMPEGLLNAFVSDAMFKYGNSIKPTDVAITNFGGLRNDLPAGPITIGHVLQVMPFDNAMVFVELSGKNMMRLCDAIAAKGGEVETGISLTICDGKAKNVLVGGKPIDENRTYRIITSDYLSFGNDHLEPLADYENIEVLNYMLRDLLNDYIKAETEAGRTIHPTLKNQIHVEK